ncbi:MAG: cell division protein FtsA [Pseudomonadota bacterium]
MTRQSLLDDDEHIVSVLDIGTSKTCCLIVALDGDNSDATSPGTAIAGRVLGYGELRSAGIRAGTVVDLAKAEDVVRRVIAKAEAMADRQIEKIVIAASCGRAASINFTATADILKERVENADVARVFKAGRDFAVRDGRALLHMNGLGFGVDDETGIADPRRMAGKRLAADLHAVTVDETPLKNLTALIDRSYLDVSRLIAAPYAGALAAIADDEARLGCLCVDIGGGTTNLAVFAEGHFIHADALTIGANQITTDIARRLGTPLNEAERLKTLHASLAVAASDAHELISYPVVDADEVGLYEVSRRELRDIIAPRMSEILSLIQDRLRSSGMLEYTSDRLVLTGGGAALTGLQDFAEDQLDMHTRIATPMTLADCPEQLETSAHAVVFGLIRAVAERHGSAGHRAAIDATTTAERSIFGQMGQWLRQSLWDDDRDDTRRTGTDN